MRALGARVWRMGAATLVAFAAGGAAGGGDSSVEHFVGTWRGSSTCVNRELAPACNDETVVYDVRRGEKTDTVMLKADKIVDGQRVPMGELEFRYDAAEACWRCEFETPRFHGAWCLSVEGNRLTGGLLLLPDRKQVRSVKLTR